LINEKYFDKNSFVIYADIGCNSKIYDYINLHGFLGLHGRALPAGFGIKIANKDLNVICFAGDGSTYNEGISHFIHACRYNQDINAFIINNQVFSLTAGQATATTRKDFTEKTHPSGVKEEPLNPLVLALVSGASFVARVSSTSIKQMQDVFVQAILHKGFSFVEIIEPCMIYNDNLANLRENTYEVNPNSFEEALSLARSWNYNSGKIPTGIFHQEKKPTFAEKYQINY
jgi:2-oxoglutarate ferredoxin oxidoreductase subunit beta